MIFNFIVDIQSQLQKSIVLIKMHYSCDLIESFFLHTELDQLCKGFREMLQVERFTHVHGPYLDNMCLPTCVLNPTSKTSC